ncbi:MAG: tail fiber domain-containing protein, partial [Proteobacteria bacterium]
SGNINLVTGTTSASNGGSINLSVNSAVYQGGSINLTAGTSYGFSGSAPGDVNITAGSASGANSTYGGNVVIRGGPGYTGFNGGNIILVGGAAGSGGASGNIGIGVTSPNFKLDVDGDINTTTCFRVGGGTSIGGTCTSDARLKEDVADYTPGLNDLLSVKLHTYKYNGLGGAPRTGQVAIGVIAQELEKTNPELVKTQMLKLHNSDAFETEIKVVEYTQLPYIVINAVKQFYRRWLDDSEKTHGRLRLLESENEMQRLQIDSLRNTLRERSAKLGADNAALIRRLEILEDRYSSK